MIATNVPVSVAMAEQVAEIFTEVLVAPAYDEGAVEVLQAKKNIRLLECAPAAARRQRPAVDLRRTARCRRATWSTPRATTRASWTLASGEALPDAELADLAFAWRACRSVKSNAILLARDGASVGVGMGQVNRVDSCKLAVTRAGDRAKGSFAASDAFFPFPDGPQILIDAGVRAIVQPGGSVRDNEVIEAATAAGVTMYLTGTRHFFH